MFEFAKGTEQSAAVRSHPVAGPHEPEFDGEPEKPRHSPDDTGEPPDSQFLISDAGYKFGRRMGAFAEPYERLGERTVGVHRYMAGYVVEDIRFGR